ncbi:MAG: hypothetical protein SFU87_10170 [Chitinophagaceae bacterium]|nr:hypothetical protein [Chitinophagaceae bacterium]
MGTQVNDDDIIIRIPHKLYNRTVRSILSQIEHLKIASKSKAAEKDIEKLLTDIKKERGRKVKALLKKKGIAVK